jgi:hypothetical protein
MCLFVLLGLLLPRVTLAILWFLGQTRGVFEPWWLGLIGFFLMPYTALAWVLIHMYSGAVTMTPGQMVVIVLAVLCDLGVLGGAHRSRARSA